MIGSRSSRNENGSVYCVTIRTLAIYAARYNSAWGAGIYGCDPAVVLQVLRRAVVPQDKLPADDLRWARTLPERLPCLPAAPRGAADLLPGAERAQCRRDRPLLEHVR